jgi:hypothetical protein
MARQRVTGVIWWRMGVSHYQSLYRRAKADEPKLGFTRDFLQASRILPQLREMFEGREPPHKVTYRWGTGSDANGHIYPAADYDQNGRVDVGQFIGGVPPKPWRIGDPRRDPEITLPGDPNASIPEAVEQWETGIMPLQPWLVMVQLDHDQDELHIRAYLENPPPELEEASLGRVPEELRRLMTARSQVGAGAVSGEHPDLWFDPTSFRDPWHMGQESDRPSPDATPSRPANPPAALGTDYRPGDEHFESSAPEPFDVDPDQRDQGTQAHHETQNALAEIVKERGLVPRSSDGEPNFDLAWQLPDGRLIVAEVKSVTKRNVERQMRFGLGQVLRYRNLLASGGWEVAAVLALSDPPLDPRWTELCDELGVGLIWHPNLAEMLDTWLG